MSYPRTIRTLIVEDEPDMVHTYRRYFDKFRDEGLFVEGPRIVWGYEDAVKLLEGDEIYHLVILDLKLPATAGGDAEDGGSRGLALIQKAAERDAYPIPGLLIVTGELRRVERVNQVTDQLKDDFFYGQIVQKHPNLHEDLRKAFDRIWEYVGFGLFVSDDANETHPSLTMREEDLLRRCGLQEKMHQGIDLHWWSASRKDWGAGVNVPEWSKILHGRFLLDGQAGFSRSRFFKFESTANCVHSHDSTKRLGSKLQHVRVVGYQPSKKRGLLVTDKAGASNTAPLPLSAYLASTAEGIPSYMEHIASNIMDQLCMLSGKRKEIVGLSSLFGKNHEQLFPHLEDCWKRYTTANVMPDYASPPHILRRCLDDNRSICVNTCDCRHGDLHMGNISLDFAMNQVNAYIIDAGVMTYGIAGYDLAALEVSLLLHQKYPGDFSLVEAAKELYNPSLDDSDEVSNREILSPTHRNTLGLIEAIRKEALNQNEERIYVCLLFDYALMQLEGLAFGTSQNSIFRAQDASDLCRRLSDWVCRLWFPNNKTS